ncbi:hypothetical protein DXV76_02975 [Rhodobacteraceae bacterium CCMM004]|nr:hypothetical protein DXV76_02975 [Rhodobacteraceae bacterium CCMM004]
MAVVDAAPIVEIDPDDAGTVMRAFRDTCDRWATALEIGGSATVTWADGRQSDVADIARSAADFTTDDESWPERPEPPDDRLFAYMMDGQPAGLMLCGYRNGVYMHVESLACNSGLAMCAGALLERAVDVSVAMGLGGKLCICGGTDALMGVYRRYGFTPRNEGMANMVLVPAGSPAWAAVEDSYRLSPPLSYLG